MAVPTARDQLFLELVNRARLDPVGDAARQGIDLNQGLAAGTISASQKQVLTFNLLLNDAAYAHSAWMLAADAFSHTGANGTNPGTRMGNAGYAFTGNWSWGENIAWVGTTGVLDANAAVGQLYHNLFLSSGHRENMLNDYFKETGVSALTGQFTSGLVYNSEIMTQDFATSGAKNFVTGVAYYDTDNNHFYSIGEGRGSIAVKLLSGATLLSSGSTWVSGGYALSTTAFGTDEITFSSGGLAAPMGARFALGSSNVKIDLVNGSTIQSSVSATLTGAALNLLLLGINNTNGTGNDLSNSITGTTGANTLSGLGGNDVLAGGKGADILDGGAGTDMANYAASNASINVNLTSGVVSGGHAAGDKLVSIESVRGSAFDDVLTGNAGDNRIDGYLGSDTMVGGLGNDIYVVGATTDKVTELANQGVDIVETSLASYSLGALTAVEHLVFTNGTLIDVGFTGTGNNLNNIIIGGAANDTLNGGAGNDVIVGHAGNDILTGGAGNDQFKFVNLGFGHDKITDYADTIDHLSFALAVADSFNDFSISGNGTKSVTVTLGLDSIVITGAANITLASDDFIFA
jgi:hypothetical protein